MKEKLQILKDLVSQLGIEPTGTLRAKIQSAISDVESQYEEEYKEIAGQLATIVSHCTEIALIKEG